MRIKDAIGSLQLKRKEKPELHTLCSRWSEGVTDGPDSVPLSEYPRPQLVREDWQCLNGWWDYTILPSGQKKTPSEIDQSDGQILVPFSPETRRSGVERTLQPGETLWYIRKLGPIQVPQGQRMLLHFGAVDERCTVYWNGNKVGSHQNGYLPFSFDVTPYINDEKNELKISVWDDTDKGTACRGKQTLNPGGMYYHAQSGIWQTVWLESVPDIYLRKLKIVPSVEDQNITIRLQIKGLEVSDNETLTILLEGEKYTFQARRKMTITIPVKDLRLWSPENPVLYPIEMEVGQDHISSYFAMRSFSRDISLTGQPCLKLNGNPYFFNGVLDQGYWPESLLTPPSDEAMVHDIMEMKRLSFNTIRKHVKIEPDRWYYHCDRLGMIVWQDMVSGGGSVNKLLWTYLPNIIPFICSHISDHIYHLFSRTDKKARSQFEKDMLRMIHHLGNHPSVGMWIPFNEGWGQFDALRITDLIKTEDPTRPVDHASGWFDQGGGDVLSIHNYFRKLKVVKDKHKRPCVLSEYGGYNCNIPDHVMSDEIYGYHQYSQEDYPAAYQALMAEIWKLQEKGLAGAIYTQLSDIEEETNGLLTYDRKVSKI